MEYGKSDIEWHINLQGMHLSALGINFGKREGSLKSLHTLHYKLT